MEKNENKMKIVLRGVLMRNKIKIISYVVVLNVNIFIIRDYTLPSFSI